jgi:hypothetical protein
MPDIRHSVSNELPSTRTLARSTAIALALAAVLLFTVVLPAEYGIDPTGLGRILGLTQMGEIKVSLAEEARRTETAVATPTLPTVARETPCPDVAPVPLAAPRTETVTITLQPGQGKEVKLAMSERARVRFSWATDRGVVNYDQHGDSKQPPRDYHGYRKGTGQASDEGELVAAFEGWHGWFWRNRGTETVSVTLEVTGNYRELKEVK